MKIKSTTYKRTLNFTSLLIFFFSILLYSKFQPLILIKSAFAQTKNPIINQYKAIALQNIYYEPAIKNIIANDCARCHSGPTRNLMDYDSLKVYAESGILETMVQGPMRRFAGNDAQIIIDWVRNGSKEKPDAVPVGFFNFGSNYNGGGQGCIGGGNQAPWANIPSNKITYNNTIKYILAKDCLQCHSSQFRNLTTYQNVKMYANNGLLKTLIQRGGPMHRFAGPDSKYIISWVNNGAPR